jgi:general secretion pathway protein G
MSGESSKVFSSQLLARSLIAIVVCFALLATSCGSRERKADRLYRKATQAVEDGNLAEAVDLFSKILEEYPETEIADRAEQDAKLYRGIAGAVERYPTRRARDDMILTARALERYRHRNGKPPDALTSLVPNYIDAEPIDPWGRPFIYYVKSGGRKYVLASLGADGAEGGEGEASDIVIESGRFVKRGDAP